MEVKIIRTETLAKIRDVIPVGKQNAIPCKDIQVAFGFETPRDVKRAIALLRDSGEPICADLSSTGGYFIPETVDEAQEYLSIKRKQLKSEQRALEPVIKFCRYNGAGGEDR
ncbi:hypothetical protein [Ruminococcus flavefaciens]|uniref:hypothetical protein n=1 Tax=Ruminococcus flavefaciens TaxID=1265 RepID=UPI00048F8EB2|nr:hypothetical protein [Ruminococcus flavefaciens]